MDKQKYLLVTGATSGIGYELAKIFAQNGHNLVIVSRNESELAERQKEFSALGVDVVSIAKDLFKRQETFALCEEVLNRHLFIKILVNDAGQWQFGEFADTDIYREMDIIDLNIVANVILTKHFLQEMISRKEGKILFLASTASKMPGPWQSVYHGSKAFILSFAEAIREETKSQSITITALMPGVTDTDFFSKADMESSKAVQDKSKMADPRDVARYDALMSGKNKIVSGFENKMQVAQSNVLPDKTVAHLLDEKQKPVD